MSARSPLGSSVVTSTRCSTHFSWTTADRLCFACSPFVQRVWIALEVKGLPYQYVEVDPYKKPDSLLEVNPRGLVPALRHGDWGCYESTVLMEYVSFVGSTTVMSLTLPHSSKTLIPEVLYCHLRSLSCEPIAVSGQTMWVLSYMTIAIYVTD